MWRTLCQSGTKTAINDSVQIQTHGALKIKKGDEGDNTADRVEEVKDFMQKSMYLTYRKI